VPIHLDNGDTLVVSIEEIISFKTDDRVEVKYKELGINEFCSPSIDCEIIEIKNVHFGGIDTLHLYSPAATGLITILNG
jgi:hypothetical protein